MIEELAQIKPIADYGAFELKKIYQKNYFKGLGIAVAIHLLLVGAYIASQMMHEEDKPIRTVKIMKYSDLGPPPSVAETAPPPPSVKVEANIAKPSVGIPVPVPDLDISPDVTLATQEEIAQAPAAEGTGTGGDGSELSIAPEEAVVVEEKDPDPSEFVAVEKYPELVTMTKPKYPEIAMQAGLTGTVHVNILVDKEGKVKDAKVVKGNEIFYEAALEAAKKCVFTPAIQNGKPVSVWVMMPFKFELE